MSAKELILESIKDLNPGIDREGPITDLIATPVGSEIDALDARILSLKQLFSSTFDTIRTDQEIEAIAATRSTIRDEGSEATGKISFRFTSVPTSMNPIPAGTELTTVDSLYQFFLVTDFSPTTTEISSSFNPTTSLYEIDTDIVAVKVGEEYNVAAGRIRSINATLPSGASIINKDPTVGGTERQSNESLWEAFQSKGILSDISSNSGQKKTIINLNSSEVKDVYISNKINPINPTSMQDPIISAFVIGEILTESVENLTVQGGKIELSNPFISSITSLVKNGIEITIFEEVDNNNKILINEAGIVDGDSVVATYFYNKLLIDLQAGLDSQEKNLFNYRLKIEQGKKEQLSIGLNVTFQSSFSGTLDPSSVEDTVQNFYNTLFFTSEDLQLFDLTDLLRKTHAGLVAVEIVQLTTLSRASHLIGFPLFVEAPSYPWVDKDNLNINLLFG